MHEMKGSLMVVGSSQRHLQCFPSSDQKGPVLSFNLHGEHRVGGSG